MWRKLGRSLHGLVAGGVAAAVLLLSAVVVAARFEGHYFHDAGDAVTVYTFPAFLLPIAGAWLGWARARLLGRTILGSILGLLVGAALGIAVGIPFEDPSAPWAGALMGAGGGLVIGATVAIIRALRSRHGTGTTHSPVEPGATRAARWAGAILVAGVAVAAFAAPSPGPAPGDVSLEADLPDPTEVESVVFMVGDAGEALPPTHPVLTRLRDDIERWSADVARDSAVVVLALGDLIYPDGMSDTTQADRGADTLRIRAQMDLVRGPAARSAGTRMVFLAGNHDWGERTDYGGEVHLALLDAFLESHRREGWDVRLLPAAGTGGPGILDLGVNLRMIVLDSAWWLLGANESERTRLLEALGQAMSDAGGRRVVVAAHHPFQSGGPHGALVTFAGLTGVRTLLSRSGAMLQDLHSGPYRDLRLGLRDVFARTSPPDLFAGGHEHSLQVIRGLSPTDPATVLISGSASKLTPVSAAAGMLIGRAEPGYARLMVLRDGSLRLFIEAAPSAALRCPTATAPPECLARGVAGYRTIWSGELPRPDPGEGAR